MAVFPLLVGHSQLVLFASHPDEDDGDEWDFVEVSVDTPVGVRVRLRQDLDAIRDLCSSASSTTLEAAKKLH